MGWQKFNHDLTEFNIELSHYNDKTHRFNPSCLKFNVQFRVMQTTRIPFKTVVREFKTRVCRSYLLFAQFKMLRPSLNEQLPNRLPIEATCTRGESMARIKLNLKILTTNRRTRLDFIADPPSPSNREGRTKFRSNEGNWSICRNEPTA